MWLIQWFKSLGKNFGQVTPTLYRGAAPKKDDYKGLQGLGITTIINLVGEVQEKQKDLAEKHGFEFVHIPMSDSDKPREALVQEFIDTVSATDKVFFVHCKGGRHRTSLMVAIYRVVFCGFTKYAAWEEGKKFGYYSALGHEPLKDYFFNEFKREDFVK